MAGNCDVKVPGHFEQLRSFSHLEKDLFLCYLRNRREQFMFLSGPAHKTRIPKKQVVWTNGQIYNRLQFFLNYLD